MLGVLWIVAASVGRIATVRGLLEYFRRDVAGSVSAGGILDGSERDVASNVSTNGAPLPALLRIKFLRAAVSVAGVFGLIGASFLRAAFWMVVKETLQATSLRMVRHCRRCCASTFCGLRSLWPACSD